jgi:hypothetical protein
MTQMKKWVHVSFILDSLAIYDLMMLADGRSIAGSLKMVPVKHGGEDQNGKLQPFPTTREYVMDYLQDSPQFALKEMVKDAVLKRLSKNAIYAVVYDLVTKKVLKKTGIGTYALVPKTKAPKALRGTANAPAEGTIPAQILATLRQEQNGSSEGVPIAAIKAAVGHSRSISATITKLVERNQIIRTAPSHYRLAPEA